MFRRKNKSGEEGGELVSEELGAKEPAAEAHNWEELTWEGLEKLLLDADVGVAQARRLIDATQDEVGVKDSVRGSEKLSKQELPEGAISVLRDLLVSELVESLGAESRAEGSQVSLSRQGSPAVWLIVGVNGVGKTTTIAKLAKRETDSGRKVVLAAGDTFRAAATEQLQMWGDRVGVKVVHGSEGGDPAAVVFDAVEHGASVKCDLVIADTAGRMQNRANLMEEIGKVRRVAEKGAGTVSEVLLVLDATGGQNGISQAKAFSEAVDCTGVVLTKLDGVSKGGIVVSVRSELDLPVKFVGMGEGIDDLKAFSAEEFVDALLGLDANRELAKV